MHQHSLEGAHRRSSQATRREAIRKCDESAPKCGNHAPLCLQGDSDESRLASRTETKRGMCILKWQAARRAALGGAKRYANRQGEGEALLDSEIRARLLSKQQTRSLMTDASTMVTLIRAIKK